MNKTFPLSCLSFSILLFFYTFYKSEIYWGGDKQSYYFIYYIISGIFFFFSVLTFFFDKTINTYLFIILTSSIFTAYIFETYLTVKYQDEYGNLKISGDIYISLDEKKKLYKNQTGKDYDTRSRFEIYNDLIINNKNIKVIVHPSNYIFNRYNIDLANKIFPLSGISNSKTIFCEEMGYYSIYDSDRFGFNNPDYEWDKQNIKYLLIGDSFTHGACVNRPSDIGSVLRQISNETVLNLGYSGNGPLIELATLKEYIRPNVENIIWFFYEGNDMEDFDTELRSKFLMKYIDEFNFSQNLKKKQNDINSLAELIIENALKEYNSEKDKDKNRNEFNLIKHLKLTNSRSILNKFLPKNYQPQNPSQPKFKKILRISKELSINNNSNFYFVYLPSLRRYKTDYDDSTYEQVKKIIDELDINFIDVHKEVFELETNPLKLFPFESSKHYNIEGYNKIANLINKIISNNQ